MQSNKITDLMLKEGNRVGCVHLAVKLTLIE